MLSIACNMIARNSEKELPNIISDIKKITDKIIVVVDSRSTDKTLQCALDLGCKSELYEWEDKGFSGARNRAIELSDTDLIFWTDCDDRIPNGKPILDFCEKGNENTILTFKVRNMPGNILFSQVRMFPNKPDVRFVYKIHETIDHAVKDKGYDIGVLEGMVVEHWGYSDKSKLYEKFSRNLPEMEAELNSGSFCPSIKFTYAANLRAMGKEDAAAEMFKMNITDEVKDSAFRDVYLFSILNYCKYLVIKQRYYEAEHFLDMGLHTLPDFKEYHVLVTEMALNRHDFILAKRFLENSLKCPRRDYAIATNWDELDNQILFLSSKLR